MSDIIHFARWENVLSSFSHGIISGVFNLYHLEELLCKIHWIFSVLNLSTNIMRNIPRSASPTTSRSSEMFISVLAVAHIFQRIFMSLPEITCNKDHHRFRDVSRPCVSVP